MRRKSWILLLACLLMTAALISTALAAAGTLNIPSGMKVIDDMAFYGDARIEQVNVPSGVTRIGSYAFGAATSLREVNLPTTITAMDTTVFAGCGQITVNTNYPSTTATLVRNMVAAGQINISPRLWQDSVSWTSDSAQADIRTGETIFLAYTATTTGTYTFASTGSLDTYGYLYDSSRRQLTYNDNGTDGLNFSISYSLSAGQKVYVGVKYVSSYQSGTVNVTARVQNTPLAVGSNSIYVGAGQTVRRTFVAPRSGSYTFYSTGSFDTYGYLYDANGTELTHDDDGGESNNFSITRTLTAGQTVILGVRHYNTSNYGTINVVVVAPPEVSPTPTPAPGGVLNVGTNSIPVGAGQTVSRTFTASRAGEYSFYSIGSDDTYGYLYSASGTQLASDDDSGDGNNFSISYTLTAGQAVTLRVKYYSSSTSGTITVMVEAPAEPTPTAVPDPVPANVHYRALLIGNTYANRTDISQLPACANDMSNFYYMLNYTIPTYTATTATNLTASQMLAAIPGAFAGATTNDVSLFYYSGHGYTNSGNLVGYDGSSLTPAALRRALDQIPGKKVVILDSCYSGNFINKNGNVVQSDVSDAEILAAQDAFVSAFMGADVKTAGLLDEYPYYVITACTKYETSTCSSTISTFTKHFLYGCGYNANAGALGYLPADSNGDRKITMSEIYSYAYSHALNQNSEQHATCYPSGSNQVLFSFTN